MNEVAELLVERGFSLTDTGGGIEQWLLHHAPTGRYSIVTDEQGEQPVERSRPVMVGQYDESGDLIESRSYASLRAFLDDIQAPT